MRNTVNERMRNTNRKRIMALHILCPIAIGALVYFWMSPDVIFVQKMEGFLGMADVLCAISADSDFLRLIRNYMPDMLWGYSLVFALFYMIGNRAADIWKVFWVAFPFSAVLEIMQKTSFISGTFDVFDVFAECLAELFAACIIYKLYSKEAF